MGSVTTSNQFNPVSGSSITLPSRCLQNMGIGAELLFSLPTYFIIFVDES